MFKLAGFFWIAFLTYLNPSAISADIYKWTDKNGKIHYSDSPINQENAEKVDEQALAKNISSYTNVTVQIVPIDFGMNQNARRDASRLVMYTTTRCGYCAKARRYFAKNSISYSEKNIELEEAYRKEFDQLGGKGVPVILVGNKKMTGFSQQKFEQNFGDFLETLNR
jgi:glutaredoxin